MDATRRAIASVEGDIPQADPQAPLGRHARSAFRVALRQMAHVARLEEDTARLARIAQWAATCERDGDDGLEDDAPGH